MADETGYIRELSRATEETPRYDGAPIGRRGEDARSELRAPRSERVEEPLELRVARLEGYPSPARRAVPRHMDRDWRNAFDCDGQPDHQRDSLPKLARKPILRYNSPRNVYPPNANRRFAHAMGQGSRRRARARLRRLRVLEDKPVRGSGASVRLQRRRRRRGVRAGGDGVHLRLQRRLVLRPLLRRGGGARRLRRVLSALPRYARRTLRDEHSRAQRRLRRRYRGRGGVGAERVAASAHRAAIRTRARPNRHSRARARGGGVHGRGPVACRATFT